MPRIVFAYCRAAVGPSIKTDRRLDVLVAEELADNFVLAGIAIEKDFGRGVPEAMRRHI
jgi:hypothetical protein